MKRQYLIDRLLEWININELTYTEKQLNSMTDQQLVDLYNEGIDQEDLLLKVSDIEK